MQPLLDRYNAYLASIGKSYQITLQGGAPTIRGYLQQGAIVIANDVWGKLREFVQWIQSEYSLTDNQTGLKLGVVVDGLPTIPYYSEHPTNLQLADTGLYIGTSYYIEDISNPALDTVRKQWYLGKSDNRAFGACAFRNADKTMLFFYYCLPLTLDEYNSSANFLPAVYFSDTGVSSGVGTVSKYRETYDGQTYYYGLGSTLPGFYYGRENAVSAGSRYYVDDVVLPIYDSRDDVLSVGLGLASGDSSFAGIIADTTTVAPLEALPDDVPWGGLAVESAGDVASPSVVEGVIAEAIEQREKPVVQPVTITVAPGTEIDPETGQTDPPVIITPFPVPAPTGLELGEELLDALETHFPFSIPWDLYNIFVHLDAQPVAPRFTLTTPALSSGLAPLTLTIDVATTPFSSFAPVFRVFTGILLAIGMLIGASRWIKR